MDAVFRKAAATLEKGEPCVLATVIRTKGSTPQKPGATLLVQADGAITGTLGGGCVEAEIWAAARRLLKEGGGTAVLDYTLNDELAAQDGLVCGGTMYFLVRPMLRPEPFLGQMREVVNAFEGGLPVTFATVVRAAPGSGLTVGSQIRVRGTGAAEGTLGSSSLAQAAVSKAGELMAYGKCEYLAAEQGDIFVEAFVSPPTLVLCGGGHVGKAMARQAKALGFRLFVIDDRPEFASAERFPEADGLVCAGYEEGFRQVPLSTNTSIVIATRGHRLDDVATEMAARSQAGYIALVGSKRKTLLVYEELFRRGIPEERIRQIHAPAGLDLGATTPDEIALSIMAEILMHRLGGTGRPLKMDESLLLKSKEKAARPREEAGTPA